MLTQTRNAILTLAAAVLLIGPAAHAQTALAQTTNPAAAYMTYQVVVPQPSGQNSLETIEFTLYGFTFTPNTLPPVGSAEYNYYTIYSFNEKSFEQIGGFTRGGFGTDNNWVYSTDYGMATPVIASIPEDPLPPSDPLHFIVGANVVNGIHLYDQTFTISNGGGPVGTVKPCEASSDLPCAGSTYVPYAAAVPEPSSYALFGLGGLGIAALAARRRRRTA